jgi:GTP-binding protein
MLISSVDYNDYVGRIAIGRIERGLIRQNQEIIVCNALDQSMNKRAKAVNLYVFTGLSRTPVTEASAGDIVAISGIGDIMIGDTICSPLHKEPLPFVKISAPTMEMTFSVNDSPIAEPKGNL